MGREGGTVEMYLLYAPVFCTSGTYCCRSGKFFYSRRCRYRNRYHCVNYCTYRYNSHICVLVIIVYVVVVIGVAVIVVCVVVIVVSCAVIVMNVVTVVC